MKVKLHVDKYIMEFVLKVFLKITNEILVVTNIFIYPLYFYCENIYLHRFSYMILLFSFFIQNIVMHVYFP